MNNNQTLKSIVIIWIALLLVSSSFTLSAQSNDFEISKNLDIYTTLYKELNTNYVDELEAGDLMKTGIEAMLKSLDPYTNYIPESEIEDYKFITTGQYGGIGALIHKNGNYIVISEPYEGFPADESGLKAGDKILEVNGKDVEGKSTSDVSAVLKGQPGTTLTLKIERIDTAPFDVSIERERITIPNIPYHTVLDSSIAYIKLTGFTQNAGKEVKSVFLEMKKNNDLNGVIIDLRGNGGGLLQEAVNICNIFVSEGEHIVSTKGKMKERNRNYNTRSAPSDLEIPLVILVDPSSASASEIVSGAIQDLDRGVIIGQRTFGKGLVQNVVSLSYNTKMKVTVAKYYIPSGRCIQAIDYSHKDEDGNFTKIPDSLITAFETRNGRVVFDGGGVEPDIVMTPQKYANLTYSLVSKNFIFNYATEYYWKHPEIAPPDEFMITDEMYNDFTSYLSSEDFSFETRSEQKLEELKDIAERENYFDELSDEFEAIHEQLVVTKDDDLAQYSEEVKLLLEMDIVGRYYYNEGRIIASLENDPEIDKALEILNDPATYYGILDGSIVTKDLKETGE